MEQIDQDVVLDVLKTLHILQAVHFLETNQAELLDEQEVQFFKANAISGMVEQLEKATDGWIPF